MSELLLTIGNKNYSSWSLRPWILMKHLGLSFEERLIPLDTPEFARDVGTISPTRRVPVLQHGTVRDSLMPAQPVHAVVGVQPPHAQVSEHVRVADCVPVPHPPAHERVALSLVVGAHPFTPSQVLQLPQASQ